MIVHPDIAALRSDPVSQRRIAARMQHARQEWLSDRTTKEVTRALSHYNDGCDLDACQALSDIFSDRVKAMEFAGVWITALLDALRAEELGEAPFRYRTSPGVSSIQILQSGQASINLVVYERSDCANGDVPQTAMFADCESDEIVLSGTAIATCHTLDEKAVGATKLDTIKLSLTAGDRITLKGKRQARQIISVGGLMVLLQLSRTPDAPAPSREFSLSDGQLLRSVSGDKAASQRLMALAVLGALDNGEEAARGAMRSAALDKAEDMDVRWEAVRQTLALDTQHGLDLLDACAGDSSDALAQPARQLSGQLRSQLAAMEPA